MDPLSNTTVKTVYLANGVQVAFGIPFAVIQSDTAETKVYKRDESTSPATVTLAVEGSDYDLTGRPTVSDPNTTVTFRVAPASGLKIQVEREVAFTQTLDVINNGRIVLEDHETALNRTVALAQQLDFRLQRALLFGRTSGIANLEIPDPVADAVIGFDSLGTSLELKSVADLVNLTTALAIANNLSDLSNVSQALINLGIAPLTVQNKVAFTDGQAATALSGETADGTVYTSVVYEYEIIRGTTVVATGRISMQYKNSVWGVVDGGYEGDPHGCSFSVAQVGSVGTLRLAASSSGGGDGTIKLKKHYFKV
jgi:hypothetical protein